MTVQRRRNAQIAKVWRTQVETNRRGDKVLMAESLSPIIIRVWAIPQRSAKAEVPGQQQINVIRVGFTIDQADVKDMTLWSRVEYDGKEWDVVTPPAYHHGIARHTRHYTLDLRERP